jgi:hypothetical protein
MPVIGVGELSIDIGVAGGALEMLTEHAHNIKTIIEQYTKQNFFIEIFSIMNRVYGIQSTVPGIPPTLLTNMVTSLPSGFITKIPSAL